MPSEKNTPVKKCDRVRIERYFLDDSPAAEKQEVLRHLDDCAACRATLTALQRERSDYLMVHPYREFAARHPQAVRGASPWKRLLAPRWIPVYAGAVACLALLPRLAGMDDSAVAVVDDAGRPAADGGAVTDPGVTRSKGGPGLEYWFRSAGAPMGEVVLGVGEGVHRAGDELQFVYNASGFAKFSLASVDARGKATLYRLDATAESASMDATEGQAQRVPFSVTLDDAKGSELFLMVFSKEPIPAATLEAWLKQAWDKAGSLDKLEAEFAALAGPERAVRARLIRKQSV